jgi:molybdopterin-guanine dinucleotide biosynthesis protein A
MDDVLGVVLTGGQSSRMGQDKALMLTPNKITWLEKQYELLSPFFYRTVVSKRKSQNYFSILPSALYISDLEIAEGPLRGILSVHGQYPKLHLFVAAVDLPGLNPSTISKLMIHFRKNPETEAVVFKGQYYEPLCAIYSCRFLNRIHQEITANKSTEFGLQKILETSNSIVLPITEKELVSLKNVNTPEDLS